jgi:hypothetical protein
MSNMVKFPIPVFKNRVIILKYGALFGIGFLLKYSRAEAAIQPFIKNSVISNIITYNHHIY